MFSEKLEISICHVYRENNINCDEVGTILVSLKKIIDSLALGFECDKKIIPYDIKSNNPLAFDGHLKAPFTIFLSSHFDLVGKNRKDTPFYLLADLISVIKRDDIALCDLQVYNLMTRKNLLLFTEDCIKNKLYFSLKVRGKHGEESINITMDNLRNAMALMKSFDIDDSEKFEYKGELVGINITNDFFAFISEDGSVIRGKLSKAMKNENFTIPSFVIALITEQEQINKLTQEKKKNYTLEKITTI